MFQFVAGMFIGFLLGILVCGLLSIRHVEDDTENLDQF